jgi:uncharacterized protein YegL
MSINDFKLESPNNYEQKTLCCFVLDVSGSMSGLPIQELERGLHEFHNDIKQDSMMSNRLEVSIIIFSDHISQIVSPSLPSNFQIPKLRADGSTKLVEATEYAIDIVNERKAWFKSTGQPYLRPWIILITDGEPDSDQNVSGLSDRIKKDTLEKKYVFIPIAVGDADMNILSRLSGYSFSSGTDKTLIPPMKLQGLKFSDFFQWVSASMSMVASSSENSQINMPSPNNWMEGFKIS